MWVPKIRSMDKTHHLLNGIECDKMSTAVAAVRAHLDRYENNFGEAVDFHSQYVDEQGPTISFMVESLNQNIPA